MSNLGEITPCWSISFERDSKHPLSKVWKSITEPDRVKAWMDYPVRIDLRVGGDWHVDFAERGALDGVIVRLEHERKLAYVWGWSVIEWELEAHGEGCRYRFMHHGQRPGLVPSEEGLAAGWHAFLDSFDASLDGAACDPARDKATVDAVTPAYRERLLQVLS